MVDRIRAKVPNEWEMVVTTELDELGDWHDLLLYRFLLMDLDELAAYDPLDVIRQIRMQFQINIAVFCFGGDEDTRDEMRLSRADRCFDRERLLEILPSVFNQYNWA